MKHDRNMMAARLQIAGEAVQAQSRYELTDEQMLEVLGKHLENWKKKIENGGGADERAG
ncbi:MAG: hypothetical protein ACOCZR_00800 [Halanaerobiales bacterium]